MTGKKQICLPAHATYLTLLAVILMLAPLVHAQAPARIVGTITAIHGNTLSMQADSGQVFQVEVPSNAVVRRITPGQRNLTGAETIQLSDLASGDRALVRINPNAPGGTLEAAAVISIKLTDLERKRQLERADWRLNGMGGLVKGVDAAGGVIMLTSRAGATAETITVRTTPTTILKRYAPDSLRFDMAQPAPIGAIHVGDQLMARGEKSADGREITATEAISGSFRNISGAITSLDTNNSTLVVKDRATNKEVTIHIRPDTPMRRLSERVAQILAARLRNEAAGNAPSPRAAGAVGTRFLIRRSPLISLAQLQKGEAVMVVATPGTSEVDAITLLAGVEPLLKATEASRQDLLSNWSMDTGVGGSTEYPQ